MTDAIDPRAMEVFAAALRALPKATVGKDVIWQIFSSTFRDRAGVNARQRLLAVLRELEQRGALRFPRRRAAWDCSLEPPLPMKITLIRERKRRVPPAWRSFPWDERLDWVADLPSLAPAEEALLRRIHDGLCTGAFAEPAPVKYRSLQLTGREKRLKTIMKSALFREGRLTPELLGCMPETQPLAWESMGISSAVLIFENAGPFLMARDMLATVDDPPYGILAYGDGNRISASVGYLLSIGRRIGRIDYVGDLDVAGLEIALRAQSSAARLGLPDVRPAVRFHRAMLHAAATLGSPEGWPVPRRKDKQDAPTPEQISAAVLFWQPELRAAAEAILTGERRIPEEVLGPDEMKQALLTPLSER